MRGLCVATLFSCLRAWLRDLAILIRWSYRTFILATPFVGVSLGLRRRSFEIVGLIWVGSIDLGRLGIEFRDDPSHHRFQRLLRGSECFDCKRLSFSVHFGRESRLGLIRGIAGIKSLKTVTVVVPRFGNSKCVGVRLGAGQAWTRCGKL